MRDADKQPDQPGQTDQRQPTDEGLTSSPWLSCGTPTSAARLTCGWVSSTSSSSRGWPLNPTVYDHVLLPVDDVEVAVGVPLADVAGAEPAVAVQVSPPGQRPRLP